MTNAAGSNKVAAVIVSYNGTPWLPRCLASLSASQPAPDIIVVDNASHDGSAALARSHATTSVIETGANLGFGRACNIGIELALSRGADYVLLLNQDAYIASDMLAQLLEQAGRNPRAGLLAPMQLDGDGSAIDPTFLRYYLAEHTPALLSDALLGKAVDCYEAKALPAAAWLLTRQCLITAGGFDPLFFMYGEDDDLCARIRLHGFSIALVPGAHFYHFRGFYGAASQQSRWQRLQRLVSRQRATLVMQAKRLEGSFWKNLWQHLSLALCDALAKLLAQRDWLACLAGLLAITATLRALPAIRRHRAICLQAGPHWLQNHQSITVEHAS